MAKAEDGLVVGADGGGTRLRMALADAEGRVLARREGAPALLGVRRDDEVIRGLREGVRALLEEADTGRPPTAGLLAAGPVAGGSLAAPPLAALCAGLAGAGSAEAAAGVEAALGESGIARRVRVHTDADVAMLDAFPEGPGILLVSGTGSIALARDREGRAHRAGGWGALLGDDGSGYALGLAGLRAAVRAVEGRGPRTALTGALFEEIGAADPAGALARVRDMGKDRFAALAPTVTALAEAGDPVAARLVDDAVDALLAHARALRTAAPGGRVALAGGLLSEGGALRHATIETLAGEGFPLHLDPVDGVRGALRCALQMLGSPAPGRPRDPSGPAPR